MAARAAVGAAVTERPGLWRAYAKFALPVTVAMLSLGTVRLVVMLREAIASPGAIGIDYTAVMDGARRWLNGDSPYLARQLDGSYQQIGANLADSGEFLYPPLALPFLAPFTALPPILWWVLPLTLIAAGLVHIRPARWSWPILALAALTSQPMLIAGNPTIWIVALALWAPATGWTGPLVLLKPTLAPLTVLGITRRSWWIAAGLLALLCIPFGALWADWLASVVDMRTSGLPGVFYSFGHLPVVIIPLVAWTARSRQVANP